MQEQLALARQDMANELEQQIQVREGVASAALWALSSVLLLQLALVSACNMCDSPNFPCAHEIIFVVRSWRTQPGDKEKKKLCQFAKKKRKRERQSEKSKPAKLFLRWRMPRSVD